MFSLLCPQVTFTCNCNVLTLMILVTPPTRRVWRSFKFAPFLFFFPVSKVGLPLMGDTAVQDVQVHVQAHVNTTFKLNF